MKINQASPTKVSKIPAEDVKTGMRVQFKNGSFQTARSVMVGQKTVFIEFAGDGCIWAKCRSKVTVGE
jgi:hypothetical protein